MIRESVTMTKQRNLYNDNDLCTGSTYLRYHVKMYVETLLWLQDHPTSPEYFDVVRNAILEDHLVHTRVLINFLRNERSRSTDLIASDYTEFQNTLSPSQDGSLISQKDDIGGFLVHITTKPIPKLKSEQEWFIKNTSCILIPYLEKFLDAVPDNLLAKNVKTDCQTQLNRLTIDTIPVSLKATT